jgi:nucleoside-diphosphate-sugar epimerase
MNLDVLFIGGTGEISLPCVEEAIRRGHRVSVLNRGRSSEELPGGVNQIACDISDSAAYARAASGRYDVVCQFLAFEPEQVHRDLGVFSGQAGQYIFISSASAYEKPVRTFPIVETVPLTNPYWNYSRKKAECERELQAQSALPYTIVRPSHTIRRRFPSLMADGDTVPSRMLRGKPIVVPGDGTSLWTITRSEDFARPFVGLFGNPAALMTDFHITSDHGWPWNLIYTTIGNLLGVDVDLVHVPTDTLVLYREEWKQYLLGDKAYTALFDNSKIRSVAGDFTCEPDLESILRGPYQHWLARGGPAGITPSQDLDALYDTIVADQQKVRPR